MSAKNRLLVGGRKRQPRREPRLLQLVRCERLKPDLEDARNSSRKSATVHMRFCGVDMANGEIVNVRCRVSHESGYAAATVTRSCGRGLHHGARPNRLSTDATESWSQSAAEPL
jgi:hypothetical protein